MGTPDHDYSFPYTDQWGVQMVAYFPTFARAFQAARLAGRPKITFQGNPKAEAQPIEKLSHYE